MEDRRTDKLLFSLSPQSRFACPLCPLSWTQKFEFFVQKEVLKKDAREKKEENVLPFADAD